jgi:hypothetical protein
MIFRSGDDGDDDAGARTRRQRLGTWLGVVGMLVTLSGLWIWVTSIEQRSELLGTVVFLVGSVTAFVGLQLVGGHAPRWKEH